MISAPDRISCLWPGLAWAWWQGSLRGLCAAIGFGWVLSLLLVATFIWPNWFASWLVSLLWFALLLFWVEELVRSNWNLRRLRTSGLPVAGDVRFSRAQEEYLRGNWFEAESLLHEILQDAPRDAEARLLLCSVLRHAGRWNAAERCLSDLEALDTGARWHFEIRREREKLTRRREELSQTSESENESSISD